MRFPVDSTFRRVALQGGIVQLPLFCGSDLLLHDFSHAVPVCDRVPLRTGGPGPFFIIMGLGWPWHAVVEGTNLICGIPPRMDLNGTKLVV